MQGNPGETLDQEVKEQREKIARLEGELKALEDERKPFKRGGDEWNDFMSDITRKSGQLHDAQNYLTELVKLPAAAGPAPQGT